MASPESLEHTEHTTDFEGIAVAWLYMFAAGGSSSDPAKVHMCRRYVVPRPISLHCLSLQVFLTIPTGIELIDLTDTQFNDVIIEWRAMTVALFGEVYRMISQDFALNVVSSKA